MTKEQIIPIIETILTEVLGHKNFELTESTRAENVDGWNSLNHMIIIGEIEKKFNIRFKLKELNKLENLGDLMNMIIVKTGS